MKRQIDTGVSKYIIPKKRFVIRIVLLGVLLVTNLSQPNFAFSGSVFDHTHQQYNEILKQVVVETGHQSFVDYGKLKSDSSRLDLYIATIEATQEAEFQSWSRQQQMAFLINAYNVLTIKLILASYPNLLSIRDLGGLIFGSPWTKKFFTLFGSQSNLDHIEHDLLRAKYRDPRLHFVLVCASRSCPPLRKEAYVAERLAQQMNEAGKNFMRDPARNRYNQASQTIEISKIFKWFNHDFTTASGSVHAFVAPFMTDDPKLRNLIANKGVKIKFLDYDWALNDAAAKDI